MLLKLAFFNAMCFVVIQTLDKYRLMPDVWLLVAYGCSDLAAVVIATFYIYDLIAGKNEEHDG